MSCNSPIPDCIPCQDCPPSGVSYTYPDCPQGEKCDEVALTECVKYKGPNLPSLGVLNNDRLMTVLTKLHKVVNLLKGNDALAVQTYTATATPPTGSTTPLVLTYLGLGPMFVSAAGATNSGATIVVGSTSGLSVGMTLEVFTGVGAFPANTTVSSITNATTFVASAAPTTNLSNSAVVRAFGTEHQPYTITVVPGTPQMFKAFPASVVIISGTGTIV